MLHSDLVEQGCQTFLIAASSNIFQQVLDRAPDQNSVEMYSLRWLV